MTNEGDSAQSDLLSPGVAALLLGVSPKTLARMADSRSIVAVVLPSGHRRYRRDTLTALSSAS
jgi:hypothetical protein